MRIGSQDYLGTWDCQKKKIAFGCWEEDQKPSMSMNFWTFFWEEKLYGQKM